MSELRLKVDGREVRLEVERQGKQLLLRSPWGEIDAVAEFVGEDWVRLRCPGREVSVRVARTNGTIHAAVGGESWRIEKANGKPREEEPPDPAAVAAGPHILKVPIPGTVSRVLVGEGDLVEPRQALVVVEAMKMENSVKAPALGRVGRIHVGVGDRVSLGDPLLEVIVG
jgi:biotin carboxyl carrier protein